MLFIVRRLKYYFNRQQLPRGETARLSADRRIPERKNFAVQSVNLEMDNGDAIHLIKRDLKSLCQRIHRLEKCNVEKESTKIDVN